MESTKRIVTDNMIHRICCRRVHINKAHRPLYDENKPAIPMGYCITLPDRLSTLRAHTKAKLPPDLGSALRGMLSAAEFSMIRTSSDITVSVLSSGHSHTSESCI